VPRCTLEDTNVDPYRLRVENVGPSTFQPKVTPWCHAFTVGTETTVLSYIVDQLVIHHNKCTWALEAWSYNNIIAPWLEALERTIALHRAVHCELSVRAVVY